MRHKRGSTLGVFQRDLCVRQDSAARIFYGPHDAAGILLRPCRTGQADIQGKTQDKKEENAMAEAPSRHDDAPQLCGLALATLSTSYPRIAGMIFGSYVGPHFSRIFTNSYF